MIGELRVWLRPATITIAMLLFVTNGGRAQEASAGNIPNALPTPATQSPPMQDSTSYQSDNAVPTARRHFAAQLVKDFVGDQKSLWTSPKNLRLSDATWLVPAAGIATAFVETDADYSRHSSHDKRTMSHYNTISNAGLGALAGGAGAMFVFSYANGNEHWRETGYLAGEAAVNTVLFTEAMKYGFGRQRPIEGNGYGNFRAGGVSFPSEHASISFAVAGVIAHEYPGPLTKLLAYGAAGLISAARVRARQHFPSDVFVGGLVGDLVAQNVYSRHYDPELGGSEWQSASQFFREHWKPSPESAGTPYVPLDSWVYPAIERLAGMGLVRSQFLGVKPWTRLECANLTAEAETVATDGGENPQADRIISELRREFAAEIAAVDNGVEDSARIESVYTRVTGISGTPLNDSYHFGQTIINDNGRPYQEGVNNITGFSAYATVSRLAIYVDGEYQHAPSAPGYPLSVQQVIANVDHNPLQPVRPIAQADQFSLQNAYLSTNIESWNFSFGRQSLWWSPDRGSSFLFSDNAAPIYMFRMNKITPFVLPWVFRYLGPMKIDLFFGRPQGAQYPPRPLLHGEKISLKPTENLELGFSRVAEFGGVGRPLTPAAIFNSYFSFSSSQSANYSRSNNPGKRMGGFEFSYRLPFVRNWLSLYADSMTPDDPSPIDAPRRAAINPGLYLSRFPGFTKLDMRVEGIYTDITKSVTDGGQYIYWELFYHDLYTNKKNIIGSWVGREGQGVQAWSTYWFNAKSNLQFGYRHQKVASDFIPSGETLNDGSVSFTCWLKRDWNVSGLLQYEQWKAPVLSQDLQKNWTSSLEVRFWPESWRK